MLSKLLQWLRTSAPAPTPAAELVFPTLPTPAPVPFDVQAVLTEVILRNSRAIDTYFPNDTDPQRVIDTHVGELNRIQASRTAAALIKASQTYLVDLPLLVAVTFVNARWSIEAFDHGLHRGVNGFNFEQSRWGLGLFTGSELQTHKDLAGRSEQYMLELVQDLDWSINTIAEDLQGHITWANTQLGLGSMECLNHTLQQYGRPRDLDDHQQLAWFGTLAFHYRSRHKALEVIWKDSDDATGLEYCAWVFEAVEKFTPQLQE